MTIGQRIKSARKKKGLSQKALANIIGAGQTAVSSWETDRTMPERQYIDVLARSLDLTLSYLEFGEDGQESYEAEIPLVGAIGAGGDINPIDDHAMGAGLDTVTAPAGAPRGTVAAVVRGTSFYPLLKDGSLIFWSQRYKSVDNYLHELVVCHLEDGRKAIKIVTPGEGRGLYTLTSSNAPPIFNVKVESVSPIDWMRPA